MQSTGEKSVEKLRIYYRKTDKKSEKSSFCVKLELFRVDARLHFIAKWLDRPSFLIKRSHLSYIRVKSEGVVATAWWVGVEWPTYLVQKSNKHDACGTIWINLFQRDPSALEAKLSADLLRCGTVWRLWTVPLPLLRQCKRRCWAALFPGRLLLFASQRSSRPRAVLPLRVACNAAYSARLATDFVMPHAIELCCPGRKTYQVRIPFLLESATRKKLNIKN